MKRFSILLGCLLAASCFAQSPLLAKYADLSFAKGKTLGCDGPMGESGPAYCDEFITKLFKRGDSIVVIEYQGTAHRPVMIRETRAAKYNLDTFTGTQLQFSEQDGSLTEKAQYQNGKVVGMSEGYYPNGKLAFQRSFKNGVIDGDAKTYDKSGKLKEVTTYKNGKVVATKRY